MSATVAWSSSSFLGLLATILPSARASSRPAGLDDGCLLDLAVRAVAAGIHLRGLDSLELSSVFSSHV